MAAPGLTFTITGNKISAVSGFDSITVKFSSDIVVLGGNGSQKTANMLSEEGLNVVSLPKTIDNDLPGTERTFEVYDDFLLSGDGEYRISLYAQGADGSWNDSYGFVPSGTTKTMLTADGKEFLCMKE